MNYIIGVLIIVAVLLGAEQWGEHRVQVQWNTDKKVREALLNAETKRNEESVNELIKQHKNDMAAAESKAGRDAVNRWLRDHRVLPGSAPVRCPSGNTQPEGAKTPDERPDTEPEFGGGIEGFAVECAKGALMNMQWRELCLKADCEEID